MEKILVELRQLRQSISAISRGDIPVVKHQQHYVIENVIISVLIFVFSIVGIGAVFNAIFPDWIADPMALACSSSLVYLFLFFPRVVVWNITRKTGYKPDVSVLKKFKENYDWVKRKIIDNDLVVGDKSFLEAQKPLTVYPKKSFESSGFGLWLGQSTGVLSSLWHKAGMKEGQQVTLTLEDACQNILVLGGIGSGKTTGVMQPILLQCLDQKCGGLIFDIKGDVIDAVAQFAKATQRSLVVLGPHHQKMNLIEGLTPEVAASFLKSAFLLGNRGNTDSFWVDTASELCRNTLGMLSFLVNRYDLQSLHQYLFELDSQEAINNQLAALLPTLPEKEARLLKTYCNYYDLIFSHFDGKIKSGVNATIAQALAPFNHPDLLDAFCSSSDTPAKMKDILNGTIYLVDMPLSVWGLGGKVAYTFIKLRFFNLMQNRNQHQENHENKNNPVFFMCDEYQEIVSANRDGLSDLNFWDKSRSSKTIGIISSQSIASFYAALGNHDLAHALLQNFRQKLCLRTEDPVTLDFMERLIGKARVKKISDSVGHQSSSKTITESREGVIDAQLFRELNPGQAVSILTLSGHSMDDVVTLKPIYLS
ncbi:MAG: type IV secretion system DNA-binding domain-containing protein [Coxiellaceae bacterium]|nr:type IV secretion system DNA-binding domain-containing protein [Coxiellaceae bacterium]